MDDQYDNTPAAAPTWAQVVGDPAWAKFSPEQRNTVREHFFKTVVAPTAGPDADNTARAGLRQQFDQLTSPDMGSGESAGIMGSMLSGFARGGLRAVRGLALAGSTLQRLQNPLMPDAVQDEGFRSIEKITALEDKLPQAQTTGEKIAQGVGGLVPGFLTAGAGEAGASGQDAIGRGATLGQAEAAAAIDAGVNLATLRLGGFGAGGTIAKRVAAQGAVGAAGYEGGRRLKNAVLSDDMRQDFDPVDLGVSVGAAAVPAALPHGTALDGSPAVTRESNANGTATRTNSADALAHGADLLGGSPARATAAADAVEAAPNVVAPSPAAEAPQRAATQQSALNSLPPLDPAARAQASRAMRAQVLDELAALHGLDADQRGLLDGQVDQVADAEPDATHGAFDATHLPDTIVAARAHASALAEPLQLATIDLPAATPRAVKKIVDTVADKLGDDAEIVPHFGDGKVSFVIRGADADTVQGALDSVRELARRSSGRKVTTNLETIEGDAAPAEAIRSRADVPASLDERAAPSNTRPDVLAEDVAAREAAPDASQPSGLDDAQRAAAVPHVDNLLRAADEAIANRRADGALHDFLVKVSPMAAGTPESQAIAKDYANHVRLAQHEGSTADKLLVKNFTSEQHAKMWRAADEESVLRQRGEDTTGRGLDRLDPRERAAVETLQTEAGKVFEEAKRVGIFGPDAQPLPSYVPRMLVSMDSGGIAKYFRGKRSNDTPAGGKIRTSTPNAQGRKYLTADETQAAAQSHDENAKIVENIRTLPMAVARLRQAVAGRRLVNQIREAGSKYGVETVVEGRDPSKADQRYFTMPDEPALNTWRPRLASDGKPVLDEHGKPVMDKVPLFVLGSFEGPLRAVLGGKSNAIYNAMVHLKQKTMSVVLMSPAIHNMVEFGRALPAMPGKVVTLKVYTEGYRAKQDPATMKEAILAGLAPIGHGVQHDVLGVANEPHLEPGRSWTAKLLGAVPGMFDAKAGESVKRWVDKAGDVWHNTLLWDRIADLQMGLYVNFRDRLVKKGLDPRSAQISAAHLANRYAGALPKEAMSDAARKTANLVLFSRTFTLGNLGALKDTLTGLPKDAQAQILRDSGELQRKTAVSIARRKAIATVLVDVGLGLAMNSVLQSSIAILRGDSTLDKEQQGYLHRMNLALQMVKENPLDLFKALEELSVTSTNEPGKKDRVLVGHAADGTAIYMRNPVGKIGEEFTGWMTKPLDMLKAKLSTFAKPVYATIANDAGFGRKLYDDKDTSEGANTRALGRIVAAFVGAQLPMSAVQGAKDWYTGNGDATLNASKVLAPLAGMTFSKGAPGGEAVGELYAARSRNDFAVQEAMPAIREQIRRGDAQGAYTRMLQLGMTPSLARWQIRATLDPRTRLSNTQMQKFNRYATPEERAHMAEALQRQQGAQ